MHAETEKKLSRLLSLLYVAAIICLVPLGVRLLFRFVIPASYPFILAFFISVPLSPVMSFLNRHAHLPKKAAALFAVLFAVAGVALVLYFLGERAASELMRLTKGLSSPESLEELRESAVSLLDRLPFTDGEALWAYFEERLSQGLPSINTAVSLATRMINGVADFAFAFLVTVVACYYMTVDRAKISDFAYKLFPKAAEKYLHSARAQAVHAAAGFLKAYGLIMLITFAELLAAFWVLDLDYALLLAVVIALVDILPVLGTGTVLVPWSLVCLFITKDLYLGIGLLVTYVAITVIRQVIEPKIVGNFMEMHPLFTLFAMFVGLKTAGVLGLLLLPPVTLLVWNIYKQKITNNK